MDIEKFISHQIESQFPQLYREDGQELISFVKSYYEFLESQPSQTLFEGRRMFEYRDIDRTADRLLRFFKNKYLAEVPFSQKNLRFIVKNVLDLYRRKGTTEGIKLFFQMFYEQDVEVYFPAKDVLKPSDSEWKLGSYIQMEPSTRITDYGRMLGKRIFGTSSKATAIADKVNFIIVNGSFVPIVFINDPIGEFLRFDSIVAEVLGVFEDFGKVDGSMTGMTINPLDPRALSGNRIGQIVNIESRYGFGGKAIVSRVNENATGEITYEIVDGGFGYTEDNTLLLVSDQILFTNNENLQFRILEPVEDQFGNRGIITGQTLQTVAFKMDDGDEFSNTSIIETTSRDTNITISFTQVVEKNSSSPGPLYPVVLDQGGSQEDIDAAVRAVTDNKSEVFLITDLISDFLNVQIDSADYNVVPPALTTMSGSANTVDLDTPIDEAFDLQRFELGRIIGFINVRPGADYRNDVYTVALDPIISRFDRVDQNITLTTFSSLFSIGDTVSQAGVNGIVRKISGNTITITPFSYEGFVLGIPLIYRGVSYTIASISGDYSSRRFGNNAIIESTTEFAVGKIQEIDVVSSGFGYRDRFEGRLVDPRTEQVLGVGMINATGVGKAEGFWASFNSHINGFVFSQDSDITQEPPDYFDAGKRIHDNDFYQEYSYELSSRVNINTYERPVKEMMHVAGTKLFGRFVYADAAQINTDIKVSLEI
jgi:hypothetical protein